MVLFYDQNPDVPSFLRPKAPLHMWMIVFLIVYVNMQISTTITIDEPAPGIKSIFTFAVPDQSSGKVISLCTSIIIIWFHVQSIQGNVLQEYVSFDDMLADLVNTFFFFCFWAYHPVRRYDIFEFLRSDFTRFCNRWNSSIFMRMLE